MKKMFLKSRTVSCVFLQTTFALIICSVGCKGGKGDKQNCDGEPHGAEQSRKRYETTSVLTGKACVFETQTRTCDNGTWSDWYGTYGEEKCEVEGFKNCGDTPHSSEENRVRWQAASVPYGSTCESQEQVRVCASVISEGTRRKYK
jgi:hypothetical protein